MGGILGCEWSLDMWVESGDVGEFLPRFSQYVSNA